MKHRFRECTLEQPLLMAPSLQEWLPENHLARFIADVAEQLDLGGIYAAYGRRDGRGAFRRRRLQYRLHAAPG